MTLFLPSTAAPRRAFTLIELLAVMGVITVLIALAVPPVTTMLKGNGLTQGGQMLVDQIGLARQQALTLNQPVEIRLYQYADPGATSEPSSSWKVYALQTFTIAPSGVATPMARVQQLPAAIIIDSGKTLSTLIGNAAANTASGPSLTSAPQTVPIPGIGINYNSIAFRFYPDGSTNLPLAATNTNSSSGTAAVNSWFMTAHASLYGDQLTTPPANFFTIQIDPTSGNTRVFRP